MLAGMLWSPLVLLVVVRHYQTNEPDSQLDSSWNSMFCKKLSKDSNCDTRVFRKLVERSMSTQLFLKVAKRVWSSTFDDNW